MEVWIVLIISLSCIAITAMIVFSIKQSRDLEIAVVVPIVQKYPPEVKINRVKILVEIYKAMTFEEFIIPTTSAAKTKETSIAQLNNMIIDTAKVGIQSLRLINDKKYVLAEYSSVAIEKLGNDSATEVITKAGEKLLIIRDSGTGQFIQHAKQAESATKLHNLANIANVVIGVAHLISGFDNAKKLGGLVKDVSRILQHRSNDMLADLEAIYEEVQEINFDDTTLDKVYVRTLKQNLKKLRNRWYNEIFSALDNIVEPQNQGILKLWFTSKKSIKNEYENIEEITLAPLHIIRRSLELERSLAIILNEESTFIDQTLKGQINKIKKLKEQLNLKRTVIEEFTGLKPRNFDSYNSEADIFLTSIESSSNFENATTINSVKKKAR